MTKFVDFIFSISRCYYALRANHYLPIIINDFKQAGITVAATMQSRQVPDLERLHYIPDLEMDTE
jgi:hypothetical protein